MSEKKLPVGTWRVVNDYDEYEEYSPDKPQIYIWDGDEQAYAPICDMGEIGDMNYAEKLANANIIAAALDLYEALEALYNSIDSCIDLTPELMKQCREALRIAREGRGS